MTQVAAFCILDYGVCAVHVAAIYTPNAWFHNNIECDSASPFLPLIQCHCEFVSQAHYHFLHMIHLQVFPIKYLSVLPISQR